jgi:hypothetical protein
MRDWLVTAAPLFQTVFHERKPSREISDDETRLEALALVLHTYARVRRTMNPELLVTRSLTV